MSEGELLALPPAIDLETANRALALSRSTGYDLARRSEYPCRVLRLGRSYRVVTADLRRLLGVEPGEVVSDGSGTRD
ncbi:integrase [Streptomyces sp. PT12]|nr:integrase [Streptomyces sp. PT12]